MTGPVVIADLPKNSRERLRIALDTWQGHNLIDLRVTCQLGASDVWSPTKKRISVNVALLPELVKALSAAEEQARALGLIRDAS